MGCGSSKAQTVVNPHDFVKGEQNQTKTGKQEFLEEKEQDNEKLSLESGSEKEGKSLKTDTQKKHGNQHLKEREVLKETGTTHRPEPDYDAMSLASVASGKSMIFPDPKTVKVLKCTPPNKGRYIRMEETFWAKKRKLIPDYSVLERIDKHVVTVYTLYYLPYLGKP